MHCLSVITLILISEITYLLIKIAEKYVNIH